MNERVAHLIFFMTDVIANTNRYGHLICDEYSHKVEETLRKVLIRYKEIHTHSHNRMMIKKFAHLTNPLELQLPSLDQNFQEPADNNEPDFVKTQPLYFCVCKKRNIFSGKHLFIIRHIVVIAPVLKES